MRIERGGKRSNMIVSFKILLRLFSEDRPPRAMAQARVSHCRCAQEQTTGRFAYPQSDLSIAIGREENKNKTSERVKEHMASLSVL